MKVAYGYTIAEDHDPFIGVAEEAAKISGWALAPGRWIVDYYPAGKLGKLSLVIYELIY